MNFNVHKLSNIRKTVNKTILNVLMVEKINKQINAKMNYTF